MSAADYYSPSFQFKRALNRDWRLHNIELLCGIVYPVVGFFVFHRVGQSQVYSVITPFVLTAGFMAYLTQRLCASEVRRESVFYYFNLPYGSSHVSGCPRDFPGAGLSLWLIGWVFLGGLLKLGGAGITACYRFHPDIAVLPFLIAALDDSPHLPHTQLVILGRVPALVRVDSRLGRVEVFAVFRMPANSSNNYWPARPMSLLAEWVVAAIMVGAAVWLVYNARIQWRKRQIGGIR